MLSKFKSFWNAIVIQILIDSLMINVGLLLAFLVKYLFKFGPAINRANLYAFKDSFLFLTVIYIIALAFAGLFKKRYKSSWDLFGRTVSGLFSGTLLSVAFVYVFRSRLVAFPTSVFVVSFFINSFLIFKINHCILKSKKRIKKQIVIFGDGEVDDIIGKKAKVERKRIDQIHGLLRYAESIDEIVISEKITDAKDLSLLLYLERKSKAQILFSPSVYVGLLPKKINGDTSVELLSTFVGRQSEIDEFLIMLLDLSVSLGLLVLTAMPMLIISILIKLTSRGAVIYKQERVGKDGKTFTLYKFRTMVKDAEKMSGFTPAISDDLRITKVGKLLRRSRLDELPQLLNILQGKMSLVGPRPENSHRVSQHKVLQGIRLAVKPGLTGLAQVKSAYDLHPKHKVRYDYLYIQRRSLGLNLKIILQTIPAVLSKKGW